jgi:Ca2+:H+ antiporter
VRYLLLLFLPLAAVLHYWVHAGPVFIINAIAGDGETTWFEGLLLVGVYALLGFAYFFTG